MNVGPYGPLLVDRRIGSSDLYPLLQRVGVPVELTTLAYGDCALLGRGEHGSPVSVGVERKRIDSGDLLSSLIHGRLNGHQIPGLLPSYTFRWLLIEGEYRADEDSGALLVRKWDVRAKQYRWRPLQLGRSTIRVETLEAWCLTLQLRAGVIVYPTRNAEHTARWLAALYKWWTSKDWDQHKGHLALDEAIPAHDAMLLVRPNLVQRWAAQIPGIGYEKALEVRKAFKTGLELACADLGAWKRINGIGDGIGRQSVKLIQEGE